MEMNCDDTCKANCSFMKFCEEGKLDEVMSMIVNGHNINSRNPEGNSAFMIAAYNGHISILSYLIDFKECNIRKENGKGASAITYASENGHTDAVKCIMTRKDELSETSLCKALYLAARYNKLSVVRILLIEGVPIIYPFSKQDRRDQCQRDQLVSKFMILVAGGQESSDFKAIEISELSSLLAACRQKIRKRLLDCNTHENLFTLVPKLNLPQQLENYLLYNMDLNSIHSNYGLCYVGGKTSV